MLPKPMSETTVVELLQDAEEILISKVAHGKPLVAAYKAPCGCGDPRCDVQFSIQITPYTEVVHDALKEIQ